jgi:hypothetical protein
MQMQETVNLTIPNLYELRLESRPEGSDQINLVVILKDVSSGRRVFAGSGAATLKVGQSTILELHQLAQAPAKFEVWLDTAYGQLPATRRGSLSRPNATERALAQHDLKADALLSPASTLAR